MRLRNLLFYVLTIGACVGLIYGIAQLGLGLEEGRAVGHDLPDNGYWQQFKDTYHHNLTHPLAILLLQILTIIITARALGFVCQKVGLPTVIGEIAAGIILGPSFLATQFPAYSGFLFPAGSLGNLQFLSQIGLILFMFVVGMELNLNVLRNSAQEAVLVSHASIIFPFTLGFGLSYFLYLKFVAPTVQFLSFGLFMGIAMSITAFPVLARIVQERGLNRTRLGALAITCAAADDITAWCLLAAVIAIVKAGSIVSALYTIGMSAVYVLLMIKVVRPFLQRMGDVYADRESLSKPIVAIFFLVLLGSAYISEVIGIHALFGAFLAGVIMPPNMRFRAIFIDKVEDVAMVLLLPLFFVYTGLRTEIGLLNNVGLWKVCAAIVAVAVTGKFMGSALAARFVGQSWRDSLMLGALMNTRGLMELVVLNIGYDLGVIGPEIFAMMVIMALVTTFMTGPTLDLIDRFLPARTAAPTLKQEAEARKFKVLVPFGDPERGRNMVRIAHAFIRRNENAGVAALHLSPSSELNQYNMAERERDSFRPIRHEAKREAMRLEMLFKPSNDIDKDVLAALNSGMYDMAIVGIGRSIYEGTLLGRLVGITSRIINPERLIDTLTGREKLFEQTDLDDRVRTIVREARLPLGIYVEKGLEKLDRVVVPLYALADSPLLTYAQKLVHNNGTVVTFVDAGGVFDQSPEVLATANNMVAAAPEHVRVVRAGDLDAAALKDQDLLLIGLDSWRRAVEKQSAWLSSAPSMLILRP
ncbi:MAG: cation:proton antiporter [Flavobacteriales bacterium]|nr:cation:proton antiporter [Flavobacteriales bacterium]